MLMQLLGKGWKTTVKHHLSIVRQHYEAEICRVFFKDWCAIFIAGYCSVISSTYVYSGNQWNIAQHYPKLNSKTAVDLQTQSPMGSEQEGNESGCVC